MLHSTAVAVIACGALGAYVLLRRRRAHRIEEPQLRFGILGTAGIAIKFCVAVKESSKAVVHAVASRSQEKAQGFVDANCPGATSYSSYEALLADKSIQAVYIPLPTVLRTEWALKAAAAGKHILIEKPVGPNAAETAEIVAACRQANVLYMDNTMFMHHERMAPMRAALDEPAFGPAKFVSSSFTIAVPPEVLSTNIRVKRELEPAGAIGDLGWYCIRFTLWAFGFDLPQACSCHVHARSTEGVPTAATATIRYADGRLATFDCSFFACLKQNANVVSAERILTVDDFVIPSKPKGGFLLSTATISDKAIHFPKMVLREATTAEPRQQHACLVRNFARIVADGAVGSAEARSWARISLHTQAVVDSCVASGDKDGAWVDVAPVRPVW